MKEEKNVQNSKIWKFRMVKRLAVYVWRADESLISYAPVKNLKKKKKKAFKRETLSTGDRKGQGCKQKK